MITHLLPKRLIVLLVFSLPLGACDIYGPTEPQFHADMALAEVAQSGELQARDLPFHGSTTGMLIGQSFPAPEGRCPPELPILAEYRGSGTATHLGRFSVLGGECMFFDPSNPASARSGEGRYRFTAANGDWLDVAYDQSNIGFEGPTSPWILWTASVRVVEGSGRFEGAEFVGVRWGGGYNMMTHETYSNMDGRIVYNASARKTGRDWNGS